MEQSFFERNKVLILGLLSAVSLALYELFSAGDTSTKVLIVSACIAAASYLAKNLRGQWASIAGLVGVALATYLIMEKNGNVEWWQIILEFIIGYLAICSSAAKSIGYEHTPVIQGAKNTGESITPSVASPNPPSINDQQLA